jgi:hypothetical protein
MVNQSSRYEYCEYLLQAILIFAVYCADIFHGITLLHDANFFRCFDVLFGDFSRQTNMAFRM